MSQPTIFVGQLIKVDYAEVGSRDSHTKPGT
jgi:hypothetical protein